MSHQTKTGDHSHARDARQRRRHDPGPGPGPGRESGPGAQGHRGSPITRMFDRFATAVARATGSPVAFGCAVLIIVVWAAAGPSAGFSEVWQLVVNTGTTIITFLMVFLIQQNQNKDSRALHVKLDELLMALKGASEKLVDIEDLDEEELNEIAERYRQLAKAVRARE
ncbi:low affinity iron permease family protein [Bordetella petrii]|uniref:low affinity iron permease family protein n=1 Tax=Bordetella petrii TaxID=94624 RepID=UPI00372DA465